ncbi:MAG: hypothetical protein HRF44_03360 [Ignavibacterium sp.]|jgi:hypothetical protein
MKKTMLTSFILASLLGVGACKSPVVPPEKQRTPREYTWTRTALGFYLAPKDIWGSSPENVYLVASSPYLFTGKIWHFDGNEWADISAVYTESFPVANPGKQAYQWAVWRIWGFGPDDVWIAGVRDTTGNNNLTDLTGFVMRYYGGVWREIAIEGAVHLFCIGGNSPNDVWVAGSYGKIFHYNGSSWTPYTVPDSILVSQYLGNLGQKTYLWGVNLGSGDGREYLSLLEWDGVSWSIAEVADAPPYLTYDVPVIIENEFYSAVGTQVRKRIAPYVWEPIFDVPGVELRRVGGLSSTNMLAVGGPGEHIVHYNGENAQRLTIQSADSSIYYYDVLMFETEAFAIGGISASTGYVLHGK